MAAIRDKDARLESLVCLLDRAEADSGEETVRLTEELKKLRMALGRLRGWRTGAERPPASARLCAAEANLWRRLGALLEPEEEPAAAEREFRKALLSGTAAWRKLRGKNGVAPHVNGGPPQTVPSAA